MGTLTTVGPEELLPTKRMDLREAQGSEGSPEVSRMALLIRHVIHMSLYKDRSMKTTKVLPLDTKHYLIYKGHRLVLAKRILQYPIDVDILTHEDFDNRGEYLRVYTDLLRKQSDMRTFNVNSIDDMITPLKFHDFFAKDSQTRRWARGTAESDTRRAKKEPETFIEGTPIPSDKRTGIEGETPEAIEHAREKIMAYFTRLGK